MLSTIPTSATSRSGTDAHDEARHERPDRGRPGQRAERQPLVVRAAVEDPVDEDRAADDRGREGIAGQQRDERGRAERDAPEQARVEERVGDAQAADDGRRAMAIAATPRSADRDRRGSRPSARRCSFEPRRVRPSSPATSATPNEAAPTTSTRPAAARRLPVRGGGPGEHQGDDPDRDVEVEDPAPGRREDRGRAACRAARRRRAPPPGGPRRGWRRPTTGPAAMPRKVSAPITPSARGRIAPPNRCDAAAVPTGTSTPPPTAWTSRAAISWSSVWGRRRARTRPMKIDQRAQEQPARAPQVGQPAGHRHGQDVDQQVAVDDPADALRSSTQADPPFGSAEVGQDRRQRDGGDHQLEPGQEDAGPDDGEQHERRTAVHPGECSGGRRRARGRAGRAAVVARPGRGRQRTTRGRGPQSGGQGAGTGRLRSAGLGGPGRLLDSDIGRRQPARFGLRPPDEERPRRRSGGWRATMPVGARSGTTHPRTSPISMRSRASASSGATRSSRWFAEAIARQADALDGQPCQYYDQLKTRPAGPLIEQEITWNAFPARSAVAGGGPGRSRWRTSSCRSASGSR